MLTKHGRLPLGTRRDARKCCLSWRRAFGNTMMFVTRQNWPYYHVNPCLRNLFSWSHWNFTSICMLRWISSYKGGQRPMPHSQHVADSFICYLILRKSPWNIPHSCTTGDGHAKSLLIYGQLCSTQWEIMAIFFDVLWSLDLIPFFKIWRHFWSFLKFWRQISHTF